MLKIKVLHATNLKFPNDKIKKTKIDCYSNSSIKYYYGSFTNNEKTENPQWNNEINLILFHASTLNFNLYSSSFMAKDIKLGTVDIDLYLFFKQESKQIINNPNEEIQFQFPISTQNAFLHLSFCYTEKLYSPISINDIFDPVLHLWMTSDPQYENDGSYIPIELEIFQLKREFYSLDIRPNDIWYYSYCDNLNSWNVTGVSSSETPIFNGIQFSQIHSFNIRKLYNSFNFFVLNVSNYSGKVTLNFIAEKYFKRLGHLNGFYIPIPFDDDSEIGLVKTIDIQVEPNKKYAIPLYLFIKQSYEDHKYHVDSQIEPILFNDIIFNTPQIINNNEYPLDLEEQEIPFHYEIISRIKEVIEPLQNSQIIVKNSIPNVGKVLLYKRLLKLNL